MAFMSILVYIETTSLQNDIKKINKYRASLGIVEDTWSTARTFTKNNVTKHWMGKPPYDTLELVGIETEFKTSEHLDIDEDLRIIYAFKKGN